LNGIYVILNTGEYTKGIDQIKGIEGILGMMVWGFILIVWVNAKGIRNKIPFFGVPPKAPIMCNFMKLCINMCTIF